MDERINKFLSGAGFCSRRAADRLVSEGRVTIDGQTAGLGSIVASGACVRVDGREVMPFKEERRVFAFYKPTGIISSLSDRQGIGISGFMEPGVRLYPVGRLDKDSEGLMLLTDDGSLMNEILRAAGGHEKEYRVTVDMPITDEFIRRMESGVPITDKASKKKVVTAPCRLRRIDEKTFCITLIQGLNRQIRRMCGFFGYKVVRLQRIRIMNITLDGLTEGKMRELDAGELDRLREMLGHG